jgi:hypothetical protein
MPKNFTPSQATAMVISPPIVELLNSIPSSATMSQANEMANFVPPYQPIVYSTPPIPPRGTGIPRGSVPNYYFNKYDAPDRVTRIKPKGGFINSFEECLAAVREDFKK